MAEVSGRSDLRSGKDRDELATWLRNIGFTVDERAGWLLRGGVRISLAQPGQVGVFVYEAATGRHWSARLEAPPMPALRALLGVAGVSQ